MAIDEQKLEEAVGKVFGELAVAATGPLIVLGDRLGLWAAMAGAGPVTPAELAAKTGRSSATSGSGSAAWPWPGTPGTIRPPARSS